MAQRIVLEIPARPDFIGIARQVVVTAAEVDPWFAQDRIEDLRLAVSEACTNAVQAHLAHSVDDRIVITCDVDETEVVVWVQDFGGGFDPDDVAPMADMSDPRRLDIEGGFGIPLIEMIADEAEFRQYADGTEVRLAVRSQR